MPRELTQLEQEVASHPSVAWWRNKMREDRKMRGEGTYFCIEGDITDLFYAAVQYPVPSRAGKDWDTLAAHIRSLIVLGAKISRDAGPPQGNELDCAHMSPTGIEKCTMRHTLSAELYFVLTVPLTLFSWERDEWQKSVIARRVAKGPLNIYMFPSFGEEDACRRDESVIDNACERYFSRVKPDVFTSDYTRREHFVSCDTRERGQWFEVPLVIVDPPSVSDLMAEIPRVVQQRRPPIHFQLPRNDMTCYTDPNQEQDFPLNCAHVGLFDAAHRDLSARRRAVLDLHKAMRGCHVYTPTGGNFRGVVVIKGSVERFPEYSWDKFDFAMFT